MIALLAVLAAIPGPVTTTHGVIPVHVLDGASVCGYRPFGHVELVQVDTGKSKRLEGWTSLVGELPGGDVVVSNQRGDGDQLRVGVVDRRTAKVAFECSVGVALESREVSWRVEASRAVATVVKTSPPSGTQQMPDPERYANVSVALKIDANSCALAIVPFAPSVGRALRCDEVPLPSFRHTPHRGTIWLEALDGERLVWSRPVSLMMIPCALP